MTRNNCVTLAFPNSFEKLEKCYKIHHIKAPRDRQRYDGGQIAVYTISARFESG